jgi:hypothetical protein
VIAAAGVSFIAALAIEVVGFLHGYSNLVEY